MIDINIRLIETGFRIELRDQTGHYRSHDRPALPDSLTPIELHRWLLGDGIQKGLLKSQTTLNTVRLRLPANHQQLHRIPWESIRRETGVLLAADPNTPFVRTTFNADQRAARSIPDGRMRLLAAVAQAPNLPLFDTQSHIAQISNELDADIIPLTNACTGQTLRLAIEQHRPHILHLSAHGEVGAQGPRIHLDGGSLRPIDFGFNTLEQPPSLVFLATCCSASIDGSGHSFAAEIYEQGVDHVIAMNERVKVSTALSFAATLYQDLAKGETLASAVNTARRERLTNNDRQATSPVCYSLKPDQPLIKTQDPWRQKLRANLNQIQTNDTFVRILHLQNQTALHQVMNAFERNTDPIFNLGKFWEHHPSLLLLGPDRSTVFDQAVKLAKMHIHPTPLMVNLQNWRGVKFELYLQTQLGAILGESQASRLIQDGDITPILYGLENLEPRQIVDFLQRLDTYINTHPRPFVLCCDQEIYPSNTTITAETLLISPEKPPLEFIPQIDRRRLYLHIHAAYQNRHRIILDIGDELIEGFVPQTQLAKFDQYTAQERFEYLFQSAPVRKAVIQCLSEAAKVTLFIQLDPELSSHLPWTEIEQPEAFTQRNFTVLHHVPTHRIESDKNKKLKLNLIRIGVNSFPKPVLKTALQGLDQTGLTTVYDALDSPKPLQHILIEGSHIIHLIGHCHRSQHRLLLHDVTVNGDPYPLDAEHLTQRLRQSGKRRPAVIIITPTRDAAGWSQLAPRLIETGVNAVLIDQQTDWDIDAYRRLYRRLIQNAPLDHGDIDHRYKRYVADPQARCIRRERQTHHLQYLIERVREFWIQDHFDRRVTETGFIDLPWKSNPSILQRSDEEPLDPFKDAHAFMNQHRAVLITGPSGSGKTFLMLRLVRAQLDMAEYQKRQVPIIFTMASWSQQVKCLDTWMAKELVQLYKISKKDAEAIIEKSEILPIFDGLDEINLDNQIWFIQKLNDHRKEHKTAIVCARNNVIDDLAKSDHKLNLTIAINLSYPEKQKIEEYLDSLGTPAQKLKEAIRSQRKIQELMFSPLMLHIALVAFWNQKISNSINKNNLLKSYFLRLCKKDFRLKASLVQPNYCLYWLQRIAYQMKWHNQNNIMIERLQPYWLGNTYRLIYIFCSRFTLCTTIGLVITFNPTHMSIIGIIIGFLEASNYKYKMYTQNHSRFLIFFSITTLIFLITYFLQGTSQELSFLTSLLTETPSIIVPATIIGLFLGYRTGANISNDIIPIEKIDWSIASILPGMIKSTPLSIVLGFSAWHIVQESHTSFYQNNVYAAYVDKNIIIITSIASTMAIIIIIGGIITGRKTKKFDLNIFGRSVGSGIKIAKVNIRKSFTTFAMLGFFWASTTTIFILIYILNQNSYSSTLYTENLSPIDIIIKSTILSIAPLIGFIAGLCLVTLFFGSFGALWWGGWSLIQHYLLRFLLQKEKRIPKDLVTLLETAVTNDFMVRNGAACSFFHIELRDYLAETDLQTLFQELETLR